VLIQKNFIRALEKSKTKAEQVMLDAFDSNPRAADHSSASPMKLCTYKNTDLTVSEVGFALWTISTGWCGNLTEGEAIRLMHKAYDLGVTLFDAADTYGNGLSEELIAKAFPNQRDEIVIANSLSNIAFTAPWRT
jgi:hypothetical protein